MKLPAAKFVLLSSGLLGLLGVTLLILRQPQTSSKQVAAIQMPATPVAQSSSDLPVTEIARQITVRILSESMVGSGMIIHRQGSVYTVLTCDHVIPATAKGGFKILTADGVTHTAKQLALPAKSKLDLALMQFSSNQSHRVGVLGNSDTLTSQSQVYATGFPNYYFPHAKAVEDTRNWGTKAFRSTTGQVAMLLERSLPGGYRLGYTNEVEQGMSGGPVLNQQGEIIAINGRLKYPLGGMEVFTFTDGTKPSEQLFQKMESLSWAIPISAFQQLNWQPPVQQ
jgi:S1-C subfamily serine protease